MPPAVRNVYTVRDALTKGKQCMRIHTSLAVLANANEASLILVEIVVESMAYRTFPNITSGTEVFEYKGLTILTR